MIGLSYHKFQNTLMEMNILVYLISKYNLIEKVYDT